MMLKRIDSKALDLIRALVVKMQQVVSESQQHLQVTEIVLL